MWHQEGKSVFSRDGSLYSLQSKLFISSPGTLHYRLLVSSLSGESPMAFTFILDGTCLDFIALFLVDSWKQPRMPLPGLFRRA